MKDILIVEDEEKLRNELSILLNKNGYEAKSLANFENVVEDILEISPDLVLLDINLPHYNGFYICENVKKKSDIPIIIITSSDEEMDELMSLRIGADDFIKKPFNVHILLARIDKAIRKDQKGDQIINHRGVELNILKGTVGYENESVDLTKNEIELLYTLMNNKGNITSRITLIEALWDMDDFVEDSTLTVNINRLREKLETIGIYDFIETKRGMGYLV